MLADSLLPHGFDLPLSGMGYIVPPASYRPVTRAACGGRLLPRERQVPSWISPSETISWTTSRRTSDSYRMEVRAVAFEAAAGVPASRA